MGSKNSSVLYLANCAHIRRCASMNSVGGCESLFLVISQPRWERAFGENRCDGCPDSEARGFAQPTKTRTKRLIRHTTKIQSASSQERVLNTLSPGCLPTITTTSTLGALRIFSSLSLTLQRSAARTATQNQSLLNCTVSLTLPTRRNYAKRRGMPPKKAVKEEKILLGRPGNNLKSGIVCLATGWS